MEQERSVTQVSRSGYVGTVETQIPAPGAGGVWQYISLPRGTGRDAWPAAAGTLRTGYCEARYSKSISAEEHKRYHSSYGSSDVTKSSE